MKNIKHFARRYVDWVIRLGKIRFSVLGVTVLAVLALCTQIILSVIFVGKIYWQDLFRSIVFGMISAPFPQCFYETAKAPEEHRQYSFNIQYPTTEDTVEEITEKYIAPNIESVSKTVEEENTRRKKQRLLEIKINFIVHSMGTGILRYYLKTHKLDNLGKVIFISPPSHGSQLSDNPISDILKDTLGNSVRQFKTSSDSFVNSLGEPGYQCYVMIGNKSGNFLYSILIPGIDNKMIPFKTSRLNNCNYKVIESATHTNILTCRLHTLPAIPSFSAAQ